MILVMPQAMPQGESRNYKILEFCNEPKSKNLMKNILQPLINNGELKLMIPDKPRSPKQKYYS
ncbi:Fic family protein [Paraclostridium bifermentans]|uniref:Fic family protein n=1 Tax=Paraclostridium bifermentans TaxID=1490 RepID=UPI000400752F|nr:hypothetical protein [Paraclostridium bifermentans]